jgi:hypothetical protein
MIFLSSLEDWNNGIREQRIQLEPFNIPTFQYSSVPRMELHEVRPLNLQRSTLGASFQKRNFLGWYASTAARPGGRIGLGE